MGDNCSECHGKFQFLIKRKLECAKCKKPLCSDCRSEAKLCSRCEKFRDDKIIDITLAELKTWPVKDLKALQEKLGVRPSSALVEKDDLAAQVFQRILQIRRQREEEERERQRARKAQQSSSQQQQQTPPRQQQSQSQPRERERTPHRTGSSSGAAQGSASGSGSNWLENLIDEGANLMGSLFSDISQPASGTQQGAGGRANQQQPPQQQRSPHGPRPTTPPPQANSWHSANVTDEQRRRMQEQRVNEDRQQRDQQDAERRRQEQQKREDENIVVKLDTLHTEAAVRALSVRQIKVLLHRHKVDFSGCVEREELLDRAMRLWKEHNEFKRSAQSLPDDDDSNLCKICFDAPVNCVFLECGHLVTCIECGNILKECPICRQYITRRIHTFKA